MSTDRAKTDYDRAVAEREELMNEQVTLMNRLSELQNEKSAALSELRSKHQKEEEQAAHKFDRDIDKQQGELRKLESQIRMAKQKVESRHRDLEIAQENERKDDDQSKSHSAPRRF